MGVPLQAPPPRLTSVSRSHPGGQRAVNEDRVLDRPEAGLWAVADGMGGHRSGEVAAERLVQALGGVVHGASGYGCLADIERAVNGVNAGLFGDFGKNGERSISGATLVTLLIHEDHYACLWAGDSRAYLLRDAALVPITRDHSVVQALVDTGALAEDGRRRHPSAHMITRAVGAGPAVELDRRFARIVQGDVFLLCSDGLTGCIDDSEIAQALGSAPAQQAADWLLATALARNASDNVSFVIIVAG